MKLAENGKTGYSIIIGTEVTEAEQYAAVELANFLKQVTGAVFPVTNKDIYKEKENKELFIFVGQSALLRKFNPEIKTDTLGPEEFIIQTAFSRLILIGGRPRGTLYAVYTFLEDYVGCRWFSSKVSCIPYRATLVIDDNILDRQAPILEYREPYAFDGFDADWSVRNKSNGHTSRLDTKHGGKIVYKGFGHTFYELVPPEKFFQKHPEYYSEINGKRQYEQAQLCLTNPSVVNTVVESIFKWLQETPEANIVSVSQNDWGGRCECEKCRMVEQKEGSPSGPLIHFLNQVAEWVEKKNPDIAIDTLAYHYTRKPPKYVQTRPNVIIRLCSIECSFAHPLDSSEWNQTFAEEVRSWSEVCNRLYIWDYVTNFWHYIMPHPNFRVLKSNINFFIKNGAKGIFEQGGYQSYGGEFLQLRTWVLAKLLWNPALDTAKLINEFLEGYYGNAAPLIKQYLDLMHDSVEKDGYYLGIHSSPSAAFLSSEVIKKADELFHQAESIIADKPDLLHRVRVARLPVYYVMLLRYRQPGISLDVKSLAERFFQIAESEKITHVSEYKSIDIFKEEIKELQNIFRKSPAIPPPGYENIDRSLWVDIQDDEFHLYSPDRLARLQQDNEASDGVAAWIKTGRHNAPPVQWFINRPEFLKNPKQEWKIYAVIKVQCLGMKGEAFVCGVYDYETSQLIHSVTVKASEVKNENYNVYYLGTFWANPKYILVITPANNPENVKAILVDRFFFKKK